MAVQLDNTLGRELNALIKKLCPQGVRYVNLEEAVVFTDGYPFPSGSFSEIGQYQVIKITDIDNGKVAGGKTFIDTYPPKVKEQQILTGGEILVAMSGSTGKTGYNLLKVRW